MTSSYYLGCIIITPVGLGMYHLVSRYYDPKIGRFLSADSSDYLDPYTLGGMNLFAYCLNNPVMCMSRGGSSGNGSTNVISLSGDMRNNGSIIGTGSSAAQVDMSSVGVFGQVIGGVQVATQLIGRGFEQLSNAFAMQAANLSGDLIITGGGVVVRASNKLGEAYTTLANTNAARGELFETVSKVSKGIGIGLFALDIGLSAYNNFSNSSLTFKQQWGYFGADFTVSTASFALGWFGGPIGAVVGLGIWAIYEFWLKDIIRGWFS